MPILVSKSDQSATQRNLLAACGGTIIGLFFGLPPAFGAHSMGLPWLPYGFAVIIIGVIIGLAMAFTVEAVLLPPRSSKDQPLPQSLRIESKTISPKPGSSNIQRRLAERKACLDLLDAQRKACGNSAFEKTRQERIVWGELLELELQDLDEQVSRIRVPDR